MKHTTYNTKLIILIAVLFFVSCFVFYNSATAQVKLETALPTIPNTSPSSGLPEYIKYLFIFGLSAITFVALAQMMIGGITYILAAGNVAKVDDAKDTIKQALLGLGLLLVSYLLLRTINPDLVNLRSPTLVPTQFKGEAPKGPTGPDEPPQSGRPSVLNYFVTVPETCANMGGTIYSPCETYCLGNKNFCSKNVICCGEKP